MKSKTEPQTELLQQSGGEKQLSVQQPSVGMMLSGLIESVQRGETTPQTVEVLKGMMDLYERTEARQAEKNFAAALVALQGETIRVQATKAVDVKKGVPRYRFAPYEEIMAIVQPMLTRHGFSITFDTTIEGDRMTSICTMTHASGHSRTNRFAVRFTTPPGSSAAQGDMATKSYAKRGALCDALNISIDHDDDARMVGAPLGRALAEELMLRVRACNCSEKDFLKYAGVAEPDSDPPTLDDYMQIPDDRFDRLDELLKRKETGAAKKGGDLL